MDQGGGGRFCLLKTRNRVYQERMGNAFAVAAGRAAVLAIIPIVALIWRKSLTRLRWRLHVAIEGWSPDHPTNIRPLPYLIGKGLRRLALSAKRKLLK